MGNTFLPVVGSLSKDADITCVVVTRYTDTVVYGRRGRVWVTQTICGTCMCMAVGTESRGIACNTLHVVHVFVGGRIVKSGDAALADEIEDAGYDAFREELGVG